MRRAIVIIMLISVMMSGCNKRNAEETANIKDKTSVEKVVETANHQSKDIEEETEVETGVTVASNKITSDFKEHFNEFVVNDIKIELPFSYGDMEKSGFTFVENINTDRSNGKHTTICNWKGNKDESFTITYSPIDSKEVKPVEECHAIDLHLYAKDVGAMNIQLYGGINMNSSEEEVSKILDTIYSNNESAAYELYVDEDNSKGISIYFEKGKIKRISLYNDSY